MSWLRRSSTKLIRPLHRAAGVGDANRLDADRGHGHDGQRGHRDLVSTVGDRAVLTLRGHEKIDPRPYRPIDVIGQIERRRILLGMCRAEARGADAHGAGAQCQHPAASIDGVARIDCERWRAGLWLLLFRHHPHSWLSAARRAIARK